MKKTLLNGLIMKMNQAAKYTSLMKTQVINALAYPADLFSRSFVMIIFMWVFFQLWRATYQSAGEGTIAGLSLKDTLWYLMIAETVILSKPRLVREISVQVKDGSIAYLLNKPYNFLLYHLSIGIGEGFLRMIVNLTFGSVIVWLAVGPPPHPLAGLIVFPAIILAYMIDFCMVALIALLAFVIEDVSAFEWIYSKLILVLGGVLIPLDFFPDWLRSIALSLPFAYTTYAPGRLFVEPTANAVVNLFGAQLAWLLCLALVLALAFSAGMRRLAINGG